MKRLLSVLLVTFGLFAYVANVSAFGPPPSWELTQGAAGVCSGDDISLPGVEVNVPAPMFASEQGVLSAPGFPNLGSTTDTNFQGVGTFGFTVFTDPYTLPANTPLTLSVTTYALPNFTGGIAFVSTMTWDCTTGQVISIVNQGPVAAPTLSQWGMIIFVVLSGLGAVYFLRRRKIA
ncbi:MAG: IPTL-CTERM sorting domain-containing protein [Nitrospirota bacterium]